MGFKQKKCPWNQESAREEKIFNMTVKLKFAREDSGNFARDISAFAREYFQKSARESGKVPVKISKLKSFTGRKKLHGKKTLKQGGGL